MISQRSGLQSLEANKLIEKLEHPGSKVKFRYKLTQKSIDLLPVIVEIDLWADTYFTIRNDTKALINELKKDNGAFIGKMTNELKEQADTVVGQ